MLYVPTNIPLIPSKAACLHHTARAFDSLTQPLHVAQINGIGSQNAQTSSVSVNPKYGTGSGQTNTVVGYTFSNQISVNVKNLTSDLLSAVLDTAVSSGGNQLQIKSVTVSVTRLTCLSWHCSFWDFIPSQDVLLRCHVHHCLCLVPYHLQPHVTCWHATLRCSLHLGQYSAHLSLLLLAAQVH